MKTASSGFHRRLAELVAEMLPPGFRDADAINCWFRAVSEVREQDEFAAMRLLPALALTLQNVAGARLEPTCCHAASAGPYWDLLCTYETSSVAEAAMNLSLRMADAVLSGAGVGQGAKRQFQGAFDRFIGIARSLSMDLSTMAVVRAARARGIPAHRISDNARFVRLGQGRHQRKVFETLSSSTTAVGSKLSNNKAVTAELLASVGIPVPRQYGLLNDQQLMAAVEVIGFPLVVKPVFGAKGKGVAVGVATKDELRRTAADALRVFPGGILVQQFVPGAEHRLLVVNGTLVAAAQRIPASVIGDGRHTVRELVDVENQNPLRDIDFRSVLEKLFLDEEADRVLAGQGVTRDSVPQVGVRVFLRRTANISTGGTGVDVTERVHPAVANMATLAVEVLGLDIAGVDYITPDISLSPHASGGAVIEVNPCPGLRPHWSVKGSGRDVVSPIIDGLFPPGCSSRVPTVAVTGSLGKTTTCRMLKEMLGEQGYKVGMVSTDGVYVDEERLRPGDWSGGEACQWIFNHPGVGAAVLETARGGILKGGLGFDCCDVAVVLNVADEHLGQDGVETLEEMARVKATVARAATRAVVLNADDPLCMAMRKDVPPGCDIVLFGMFPEAEPMAGHARAGGHSIFFWSADGSLEMMIGRGSSRKRVMAAAEIRAYRGGLIPHNLQNVLAAAATAHAMGVEGTVIRRVLSRFEANVGDNPGRLSEYEGLPFRLIIDRPVNAANLTSLCHLVQQMPCTGKRILAMTAAGNRRDSQLEAMAAAVAACFDHYILFDWDSLRGRKRGEVSWILARRLGAAGVSSEAIEIVVDQAEAYHRALTMAHQEDIVALHCIDTGLRRDALFHLLKTGPPFSPQTYRDHMRQGRKRAR
ncbi:MAG: ATP-grasp domain-containing protein [Deltaproteobacteria bacterium]|nr:ATP-grasp domain-containing protein [Candidatus Anaeroferrophillus wilburensis]MBN2888410.1 ATP-grasp domain-containing protein [Deltaproteobacteria bacterium]